MKRIFLSLIVYIFCTNTISVLSNVAINEVRSSVLNGYNTEDDFNTNVADIASLLCPESFFCEEDIADVIADATNTILNGTDRVSVSRRFLLENAKYISPCCSKCSCKQDCHQKSNCCTNSTFNRSYDQGQHVQCVPSDFAFRIHGHQDVGSGIYMITSCNSTYPVSDTKKKCENPNSDFQDEILPVHSETSRSIYFNIYCALCNFMNDTEEWGMRFILKFEMRPNSLPRDSLTFYRIIIRWSRRGRANIVFSPRHPDKIRSMLEPCVPSIRVRDKCLLSNSIATNGSTGNFLPLACKHSVSLFLQKQIFKNIFCLICSHLAHSTFPVCTAIGARMPTGYVTGLLDFTSSSDKPSVKENRGNPCNCTDWFDKNQGLCRPITCPLFERRINCECTRMVVNLTGLVLNIRTTLRIVAGQSTTLESEILRASYSRKLVSAVSNLLVTSRFDVLFHIAYLCRLDKDVFVYFMTNTRNNVDIDHDIRDDTQTLYKKLSKHPVIEVGQMKVRVSLGPFYDSTTWTIVNILNRDNNTNVTNCMHINHSSFKAHGTRISLFRFRKLVFCTTVKLLPGELDSLKNVSAKFMDEKYLPYIYDKKTSDICLEDFEQFLNEVSGARTFLNTYKFKIYVLVIFCITNALIYRNEV